MDSGVTISRVLTFDKKSINVDRHMVTMMTQVLTSLKKLVNQGDVNALGQ
jgi:hypothetical protein